MGVTITQSASSASRTGSGQSHEIALMATKKSLLIVFSNRIFLQSEAFCQSYRIELIVS